MFQARLVIIFLTICATATVSVAQNSARPKNSPEEQVKQVERDWLVADAKGDAASLDRMIADDFIGTSFAGGLLYKPDIIPQRSGPGGFAGAKPGPTNVRVFGDTAVLMGFIDPAGQQSNQIRVTLVFQKRSQGWQIIAAQLSH
jgi:ketosteroid isomerase-like protein